jgi:hypothetical protein
LFPPRSAPSKLEPPRRLLRRPNPLRPTRTGLVSRYLVLSNSRKMRVRRSRPGFYCRFRSTFSLDKIGAGCDAAFERAAPGEAGDVRSWRSTSDLYMGSRRVRRGATWIGVLAVVYAIGAPFNAAMQMVRGDRALGKLSGLKDTATLRPIDGHVYTVAEYRHKVETAPMTNFVTGLVVACLMGLLWRWARRAPLPALVAALVLFVAVQIMSAVVDPGSIATGVVVKVLALVALVQGLRATLQERAAARRASDEQ